MEMLLVVDLVPALLKTFALPLADVEEFRHGVIVGRAGHSVGGCGGGARRASWGSSPIESLVGVI